MTTIITNRISRSIKENYDLEPEIVLTTPPDPKFGDYATNVALVISKQLKLNPRDIALKIKNDLKDLTIIKDVVIEGPGFINLVLDKKTYIKETLTNYKLNNGKTNKSFKYTGKKVTIEHTAANPNKSLHIGHLRNFSIADSLVRFYKEIGSEVVVQYFNNNLGLQVAKVVWGIKNIDKIGLRNVYEDINLKFDSVCARIYVASEKLSIDPDNLKQVEEIMVAIENEGNENAQLLDKITEKILKAQLETCFDFGVNYDEIITDSAMTRSKVVERVIKKLLETGKVKKETTGKNAGCIVITGIKNDNGTLLPDKVLVRNNGTYVYTAKDIVLHLYKFGLMDIEFKFEPLDLIQPDKTEVLMTQINGHKSIKESADLHINVVDTRQSFPLEVVKQSLRALGFNDAADKLYHLAYEVVSLSIETARKLGFVDETFESKSVAMSGRKGIEIGIDNLLSTAKNTILQKNQDKSETISEKEAKIIAAGALRYYMIRFGFNTEIVFDLDDALRTDGNTGIYLMYAYVRAYKIISKSKYSIQDDTEIQTDNLTDSETDLIFNIIRLFDQKTGIYRKVEIDFSIIDIANLAYEIAIAFSAFYQKVHILEEKDIIRTNVLLDFLKYFETEYKKLLEIIFANVPTRM